MIEPFSTNSSGAAHRQNLALVTADDGSRADLQGTLVTFKVRSEDTGGAYAVVEIMVPPNSGPPKMHTHPALETFQLLDGEFEFRTIQDGEPMTISAIAPAIVHVPSGTPHTFKNVGSRPARCQIILSPGSMEGYFTELSKPVTGNIDMNARKGPPDVQHFIAVGRKYGVAFAE
jgi:quercetin dioxygenase-like cupin family protein